MEQQLTDTELLIVLCHFMILFGGAAFIGVLISDHIITPFLAWMDLIKTMSSEDNK